jgi:hypothetical protein
MISQYFIFAQGFTVNADDFVVRNRVPEIMVNEAVAAFVKSDCLLLVPN